MRCLICVFILFFTSLQTRGQKYTNGDFYISFVESNSIEFYLPSYNGLSVRYAGSGKYQILKNKYISIDLKYGYFISTSSKYTILGEKLSNDMSTDIYVFDKDTDECLVGAIIRYKSLCDDKFYNEAVDTGRLTLNYKGLPNSDFVTVEAGGYQACRMQFSKIINKAIKVEMAAGWITYLDDTTKRYNIKIKKDNEAIWILTGIDKYEKFILEE